MSAASRKDTRERRDKSEVDFQMKMQSKKTERNVYERYTDCTKGPITFDNIWKEVVSLERKLQREWWKRYGHLSGEMLKQILAEECVSAGLPVDTFERKPPEDLIKKSPIPLKSSSPVPKTSSARIGWRSSLKECNLEFTGPMYISAKRTIEPPLEPGEFRISQQKFIYLG